MPPAFDSPATQWTLCLSWAELIMLCGNCHILTVVNYKSGNQVFVAEVRQWLIFQASSRMYPSDLLINHHYLVMSFLLQLVIKEAYNPSIHLAGKIWNGCLANQQMAMTLMTSGGWDLTLPTHMWQLNICLHNFHPTAEFTTLKKSRAVLN